MQEGAFGAVALELLQVVVVGEAELADVDHVRLGEGLRVGREVPGLHLVRAHLDALQVAHAADLRLVLRHAAPGTQLLDLLLAREGLVLRRGGPGGFGGRGGILQVGDVEVLVTRLGRAGSGELGSDDGDGLVAARAVVFLAGADEGGTDGRCVAGRGGEFGGFRCFGVAAGGGGGCSGAFLAGGGFGDGSGLRGGGGLLLGFLGGGFGLRPFDLLGKIEAGGRNPL